MINTILIFPIIACILVLIIKNKTFNKSWVVFQPHTYSRTKSLLDDFAKALSNFDNLIVLDIYAAREQNTFDISSKDLVKKLEENNKKAL